MPQIASYQVAVGMRHGGSMLTDVIQCRVPDIVTADQAEKQLYEQLVGEWHSCLGQGKPLALDRTIQVTGRGWFPIGDGPADRVSGLVAVHPDEVAWLQVAVTVFGPEQADAPVSGD